MCKIFKRLDVRPKNQHKTMTLWIINLPRWNQQKNNQHTEKQRDLLANFHCWRIVSMLLMMMFFFFLVHCITIGLFFFSSHLNRQIVFNFQWFFFLSSFHSCWLHSLSLCVLNNVINLMHTLLTCYSTFS